MIAAAIALALTAAVVHGTWNVMIKVSGDPLLAFRRATLASGVVATVLAIPAWLWLGRPALAPLAVGLSILSSFFETVYLWLLSAAYRRGDLSAVYPIARGSAPMMAVLAGIVLIGERLDPLQLAGVALLLFGILVVSVSQSRGRATVPALLTGVAIATYTSIDRVGVRLTSPWIYGWLLFTLMAIELPVSIWIVARLRGVSRAITPSPLPWRQSFVIGAFMWTGYFLVLWALSIAPLAIVAPVRETSVVGVAVWGVWKLRERGGAAMKLSGAVATLAGVALLAV